MAKKKVPAVKTKVKTTPKEKEARILVYNSSNQVERNKLVRGTDEDIRIQVEFLRKTSPKTSRVEIQPL